MRDASNMSIITDHFHIFNGIGPKMAMKFRKLGYSNWADILDKKWKKKKTPKTFLKLQDTIRIA